MLSLERNFKDIIGLGLLYDISTQFNARARNAGAGC